MIEFLKKKFVAFYLNTAVDQPIDIKYSKLPITFRGTIKKDCMYSSFKRTLNLRELESIFSNYCKTINCYYIIFSK